MAKTLSVAYDKGSSDGKFSEPKGIVVGKE